MSVSKRDERYFLEVFVTEAYWSVHPLRASGMQSGMHSPAR